MTQRIDEVGIGGRVRAARERLGLSREALAFHSGISWSAIAQIESGRRANLRLATLTALADALDVTIDYLVRSGPSAPMFEHQALLYEDEDDFLATAAPFLAQAFERSEPVLAVTDTVKIEALRKALGRAAQSVRFATQDDWYATPAQALAGYHGFVSESVAGGAPWVRVLGEPIWEGRSGSEVRTWCRYESLLNLTFSGSPLTLLCPYRAPSCGEQIVAQARASHPKTIEAGGVAASPTYRDPDAYLLDE